MIATLLGLVIVIGGLLVAYGLGFLIDDVPAYDGFDHINRVLMGVFCLMLVGLILFGSYALGNSILGPEVVTVPR